MGESTGGDWWRHDEPDVSSRRSASGERGPASSQGSRSDDRGSRPDSRDEKRSRPVSSRPFGKRERDDRSSRGAASPSNTAPFPRNDAAAYDQAGSHDGDSRGYEPSYGSAPQGRGGSYGYEAARRQDPRTIGREAPRYAGQANESAEYGPSTYTAEEYSSHGYSPRYARARQREEGYRIDPAAGRRQAEELPYARRRSGGQAPGGSRPSYHHNGPANSAGYGAADRFPNSPASIPDERDPRARRRRPKQRPLGWSSQNVPQMNKDAASRGGWSPKVLNGKGGIPKLALIVAAVLAVVLVFFILRGMVGCVAGLVSGGGSGAAQAEAATTEATTDDATQTASYDTSVPTKLLDEGRKTASGMGRMSFSAVGDNLANSNLLSLADSWAGSTGDGEYDFSPFYTEVSSYIQTQCDVSFINQETTLGGTDQFDYAGYPSYNTPDTMADALADVGWRIVNLDTNHTYDTWTSSIEHAQQVWNTKSNLLTIGSYGSEDDRSTIRVVECNGIRLAALAYCYGQNGYEQSDLPNDYYAVPYDEEKLKSEVAEARKVADVVLVYMHWGTEYTNEPNDEQKAIAQVCADNGVDVVIGSHAHVIQPVEWVSRADGGKMLCAYGLGDFLSGYGGYPDCIMSGMLTCDFVRVGEDGDTSADNVGPGGIAVENVVWHPLVEHMVGSTDTVRFVKGYTEDEANANELLSTLSDPLGWLTDKTREVIGDDITIDV